MQNEGENVRIQIWIFSQTLINSHVAFLCWRLYMTSTKVTYWVLASLPGLPCTSPLFCFRILYWTQTREQKWGKLGNQANWVVKYLCYSPSWVSAATSHVHVPSQPHQHIHIQASLVPRPRPLFIYWFAFSIMHGCGSVAEQKTGNKNKGTKTREAWERGYIQALGRALCVSLK